MNDDRSEERYQAFIRNSSEGIWLCEVDEPISINLPAKEQVKLMYKLGYMAEANDAMAAMYAVPDRSDLIGLRIPELLVEDDPKNTEYLTAFVESGYRLNGVESHELDQDGNEKIFRNSLVGVIEDGHLVRAWGTQQDVTEQYRALKALKKSEDRLDLALEVSGTGIWEWDISSNELIWSDSLKRLFGLKPKESIDYKKYITLLHPDDRVRMKQVIDSAIKNGKEYEVEHRTVWPDDTLHWVVGRGKALYENGKPVRMLGTTMSIEDIKRKAELEQINKELRNQQDELRKLNQIKDEFISLASHQLRTPATAVKQYLGMVLQGYQGDITDTQKTILGKAYASNERQIAIINDLLRVAQLDAGKITLQKTPTDILDLLAGIIEDQKSKLDSKKQKVKLERGAKKIQIVIDQPRMRMALDNIIDNASKYSAPEKDIVIKVRGSGKNTIISIADQGIGIKKRDIPRMFEKFIRLEDPLMGGVSGTGLGLYWASKIISLHDGSLTVESKHKKGSVFIVTLPGCYVL